MRSLHVQTQQLQIELQDLERKKKFKTAEVHATKEHIEAAKVPQELALPFDILCISCLWFCSSRSRGSVHASIRHAWQGCAPALCLKSWQKAQLPDR